MRNQAPSSSPDRAGDARRCLDGLALGDAFGQRWFFRKGAELEAALRERRTPGETPWYWTDDTAMALRVVRVLVVHGRVDQDVLAREFASAYVADPYRGYGGSMHGVLTAIHDGEPWREVTRRQFEGQGSWGNGSAMRVAPLGAWFRDDLDLAAEQAALQAETTHAHPEATAGAVAVAVAAALAAGSAQEAVPEPAVFLRAVADRTPDGDVAAGLRAAAALNPQSSPRHAASALGSGHRVSCPDTVPFALWCAARHLDDLTEALWTTAAGLGDLDTTCAIAGGVVAARTGVADVPALWRHRCEPIPDVFAVR